ncbi:MAG TPA: VOC family protein [Devosia sp.]|jgi:predicted enzyme related to lactoylglutathione lyase|nr:VOC family protein [Devosia sp.]
MTITNALAGIAVDNLAVTLPWYERVFGRPADARPMVDIAEWKFPTGGWVHVATDADRAGASSVTLIVDDLAAHLTDLEAAGITPVSTRIGDYVKTAIFRDPDGNRLIFTQPLKNTY